VAYTASIAIAVKGIQDVKALQEQIEAAAKGVDRFNNYAKQAFDGDFVRSIRNLNSALKDATDAFDKAALGTSRARDAASAYLAANREIMRGLEDRKRLLREVAAAEAAQAASASGMQFTFGGPKALPMAGQTAFKGEVVGGLGGGARAALQNYEMLVGAAGKLAARTQAAADMALRFSAATQQQIPAFNHFAQIYQGIYLSAVKLSQVKALPSSEMLKEQARGLQTIESINRKIAKTEEERVARLERVRKKAREVYAEYEKGRKPPALPPATEPGLFGKLAAKPGMADAIIGGAFPLLFGGGPGAAAGGFLGGLAGGAMGNPWGMALSLAMSAVGMNVDEVIEKFAELQAAAKTLNVDGLRDSVLFVNSAFEVQVERLVRLGELDQARLQIQKEITKQTGIGTGTQEDIENSFAIAKKGSDDLTAALGGLFSIIQAPLNVFIGLLTEGLAVALKFINSILSAAGDWLKSIPGLKGLSEAFKMPNEELEKANAKVQLLLDKTYEEIFAKQKILDLEKQRTLGRTAEEKAINALIDKEQKIAQIKADSDKEIKEFYDQNRAASIEIVTQGVNALKIKRDQLIEEIEIADKLQEQLRIQEAINEAANIRTKQLELAKMQEEIAIRIAQLNNTLTQQEAERLITANELLLVQQQINNEQSRLAQLKPLLTDEQILDAKNKIAGLQLQEVNLKLRLEEQEIERIKEQIARFKDVKIVVTINNEKFFTSLKTASEVIQSTTNLFNAQFAAQKAINDLLIQRAEQEGDLDKAYALRVKQVELTYRQTVLQIQVEVEQARIKLYQVRLEHQKLALQMQQISLVRKLTGTEVDTLKQSKEMLKLMEYQLALVIKAAGYRFQEAEAIRKMTLEQLAFNRAKEQGERGSEDRTITQEGIVSRFPSPSRFFAAGGYVDKPTVGLIGEGNEGEFVIPESKMAAAMDRYAAGRRGEATIPVDSEGSFGQGSSTSALGANMPRISNQINVTTGPVMQLDGKTYVSQQDMAQSLRSTADTAVRATLKMLQYNTQVRKSIGIA